MRCAQPALALLAAVVGQALCTQLSARRPDRPGALIVSAMTSSRWWSTPPTGRPRAQALLHRRWWAREHQGDCRRPIPLPCGDRGRVGGRRGRSDTRTRYEPEVEFVGADHHIAESCGGSSRGDTPSPHGGRGPDTDGPGVRKPTGSRTTRRRDPRATEGASGVGERYST